MEKILFAVDELTGLILGDDFIKEKLVKELSLPRNVVERIVADIVIYTHGLATMLLWDSFKLDKQTAFQMIYDQGLMCFSKYGIDLSSYDNIQRNEV